jgi:hypothetical protein
VKNKLIIFLVFSFFSIYGNLFAQNTYENLNLSYNKILEQLKSFKIFIDGKNKKSTKLNFKFSEIKPLETQESKYLSANFISYKMPYSNFTYNYYFNNEDICDSVVVFENACLECARRETETELILFLETWLKVANNEYEKSYTIVNPRKIFSPKTKLFIKLVADPMPSTGECKKWIFTLKNRLALSD